LTAAVEPARLDFAFSLTHPSWKTMHFRKPSNIATLSVLFLAALQFSVFVTKAQAFTLPVDHDSIQV
jgi:hypothetical protein